MAAHNFDSMETMVAEGAQARPAPKGFVPVSLADAVTMRPEGAEAVPVHVISDPMPDEPAGRLREGDELLGRYTVMATLGEGGMGVVYKCFDKVGGVEVAVKGLPPEVSHATADMEAIRRNFQLVAGLRHPGICGVRNLEKDADGNYYLVMDLAEGMTLTRWLRIHTAATIAEKTAIVAAIASALDYAHSQRVIHRDIKCENVMVGDSGAVRVLDFGLAAQIKSTLSKASSAVTSKSGSPGYKAPEQWLGRPQSAASDQYSLAVVAYYMFAGQLPFDGDDMVVLGHAVLSAPVVPIPGLPAYMNAALAKALAKTPEERFSSCAEFVAALSEPPPPPPRPTFAWKLLATLAILGVGFYFGYTKLQPKDQPPEPPGLLFTVVTNPPPIIVDPSTPPEAPTPPEPPTPPETPTQPETPTPPEAPIEPPETPTPPKTPTPPVEPTPPETPTQPVEPTPPETPKMLEPPEPSPPVTPPVTVGLKNGECRKMMLPGGVEMEMVYVAPGGGAWTMGDFSESAQRDATPHQVRLTKPYWIGKYPVTQAQWDALAKANNVMFGDGAPKAYFNAHGEDRFVVRGMDTSDFPMEGVSWDDCDALVKAMTRNASDGRIYTLPTEAQWEFAARGGTKSRGYTYSGGDELGEIGWFQENSGVARLSDMTWDYAKLKDNNCRPHSVRERDVGNELGIVGMSGNVWEWCSDWYGAGYYKNSPLDDPQGPAKGTLKVLRGGCWDRSAKFCTSAARLKNKPDVRDKYYGFRLCCSVVSGD